MKKMLGFTLVLISIWSLQVLGTPPEGANSAQIFKPTFCPFFVYVEPGVITPALPGGYGVMVTNLNAEKGQVVATPAGDGESGGKYILNCQGSVNEGETIVGLDAFNPSAGPVEAVVAQAYEACVASNIAFPGTCKGTGTYVVKGEDVGANCNFLAGLASTRNWQQITSKSGQYNLKCKAEN
jgi:hypothetical protein